MMSAQCLEWIEAADRSPRLWIVKFAVILMNLIFRPIEYLIDG